MGTFLFSCGEDEKDKDDDEMSACDCVNATKEELKDEDFKKACDELGDEWEKEYKEASKYEKKEMRDELEACRDDDGMSACDCKTEGEELVKEMISSVGDADKVKELTAKSEDLLESCKDYKDEDYKDCK